MQKPEQGDLKRNFIELYRTAGMLDGIQPDREELVPHYASAEMKATACAQEIRLSAKQQRLYFLQQTAPDRAAYQHIIQIALNGAINILAIERCLNEILQRHDVLRMVIHPGDVPSIHIKQNVTIELPVVDLRSATKQGAEEEMERLIANEKRQALQIESGVLRPMLIRVSEAEAFLLVSIHDIASDIWSAELLHREFCFFYDEFSNNRRRSFSKPGFEYTDFAECQRQQFTTGRSGSELDYWQKRIGNSSNKLLLPTDYPRPEGVMHQRAAFEHFIPASIYSAVYNFSDKEQVEPYVVLLAVFETLLHRYTRQESICVGVPFSGRYTGWTDGIIGPFSNLLPIGADFSEDTSFRELLCQFKQGISEAIQNRDVPCEMLLDEAQWETGRSGESLYQVAFRFREHMLDPTELPDLTVSSVVLESDWTALDLTLEVMKAEDSLSCYFFYNEEIFKKDSISRIALHFQSLLQSVVSNPDERISALSLITPEERKELLLEWNTQPKKDSKGALFSHQVFDSQVEKTPDAIALVDADRRMSYRELQQKANQLAHNLQRMQVGPDVLVGICMERSIELVISVLAILKAGGACVPLDPGFPKDQLIFMLNDVNAPVVLTQQHLMAQFSESNAIPLCLDEDWEIFSGEDTCSPVNSISDDSPAFVLYTSGTTSKPKAVIWPQFKQKPNDSSSATQADYQLAENDRHLLKSSIGVSLFVREIFWPLLSGGRLYVVPAREHQDVASLVRRIERHKITIFNCVPSLLSVLLEEARLGQCDSLRHVICFGEVTQPELEQRFFSCLPAQLSIYYGATEAPSATFRKCSPEDHQTYINIGRRLENRLLYVLDAKRQPVPIGVPGELYVGGRLTGGYLNRPELTAERFVPNPFQEDANALMYKTGDLVRYREGAYIEYMGRIDQQIKIRGFRVEPSAIEAVLSQHELIRACVVVAREGMRSSDKILVAYLVTSQPDVFSPGELRKYVQGFLPDYMVPSKFVMMDALPIAPSGKVDRNALPEPDQVVSNQRQGAARPKDPMALHLTKIWEDVLGVESIGVQDNFFDLGGHSLLAVKLFDQIERQFGKKLPLDTLWFEGGTIESIAQILKQEQESVTWPELVEMQGSGNRDPLFCVHTMGGNLFHYNDLVTALGPNQPVYGLQARGVYGKDRPRSSIEAIAADCIGAMRICQPRGPYRIMGFSSGGTVAYEMSQQLSADGQEVSLLALLDTYIGATPYKHQYLKQIKALFKSGNLRSFQERLYFFGLNTIGAPHLRRLQKVGEAHRWAHWSYVPKPYQGEVDLFLAADGGTVLDPKLGWGQLVTGGLKSYVVPGTHGLMVKSPNVEVLAEKLKQALDLSGHTL